MERKKIIAFDLDDVLCERFTNEGKVEKYFHCVPIPAMVKIVNECYDSGHTIVVYTARGMNVFRGDVQMIHDKLFDLTTDQLREWGVKYHKLVMGKQHYDILIDDKAVFSEEIKNYDDIMERI